mgnify:CR=1 FL=1
MSIWVLIHLGHQADAELTGRKDFYEAHVRFRPEADALEGRGDMDYIDVQCHHELPLETVRFVSF